MDTIFQAFAVKGNGYEPDPDGVLEDINIPVLESYACIPECNALMLSELCQYRDFKIGTRELRVTTASNYWVNANNLSDSVIGGPSVSINGIDPESCPTLLIKNRPKGGVMGCHTSKNLHLINLPHLERAALDCEVFDYSDLVLSA